LNESFTRLTGTSASIAQAVGRAGTLVRTLDGGRTWAHYDVPTSSTLIDAAFADAQNGFALDRDGNLFESVNGGASWRSIDIGNSTAPTRVIALDSQHLLLIGPRGVRRSADSANSFSAVSDRAVSHSVLSDAVRAGGTVAVFGPRALATSSDTGRHWTRFPLPSKSGIQSASFTSARQGFVLDRRGRVWHTKDFGRHWSEDLAVGFDGGSALSFADVSDGFLAVGYVGGDAYVFRTSDGGTTWRPQLLPDALLPSGLFASSSLGGFGLGFNNDLFATNTGGDLAQSSRITLRASRTSFSGSQLKRAHHQVNLSGRISPAPHGHPAVLSIRRQGSTSWRHDSLAVRSDGTFSETIRLSSTTVVVAQWVGDDVHSGAGSPAVVIRVH
jgi:photosystem II stability/assembly factor-like uncharacterized protein